MTRIRPLPVAWLCVAVAMLSACSDASEGIDAGHGASDAQATSAEGSSADVPGLSLGPILGAVTDTSVKVWVRADRDGWFRVRYRETTADDVMVSEPVEILRDDDFTATVLLSGLKPSTDYRYEVVLSTDLGELVHPDELAFRTLPSSGQPLALRFAVGADINQTSIPALDEVAGMNPAFMLLIGDNIYADRVMESAEGYRAQYRKIWGGAELRDLMTHVPVFMTWDDHEVRNDWWQGLDTRYVPAREAFDEYQASHNPDPIEPGEIYYSFSAGDVDFFVLETRSNRSPNGAVDNGDKSMLGEAQLAALEEWLLTSQATFKVLVSSVMWSNFGTTGSDSWRGFRDERQRIIDTIYDNHIEGVVQISGDQHWSAIFRNSYGDPPLVIYELEPTPLAISNRVAPATDDPSILYRDDDHHAYGVVDIDTTVAPATIKLTVCATDLPCDPGNEPLPSTPFDAPRGADTIPTTISLTLNDMGFGDSGN